MSDDIFGDDTFNLTKIVNEIESEEERMERIMRND